jgi:catechol 2,3-dioxygenase-like lactoylglutathione lyase family enzyme
MSNQSASSVNVRQAVPFLGVTEMERSLRFYVDGLGFRMKNSWIPEERNPDGRIRWCWLELGDAAIMLQEFQPEHRPSGPLGTGTSVCFMCNDALALYREFKSRGIQTRNRPTVGNRLWVVSLSDPDGYRVDFESPTDEREETELKDE